ncbi:hypothetical protein [Larkinella punicea]|uniref:Uncharacterized protein n=1 Tax=Larkinella punicea TaxID=2315727 RepID=A0A368JXV5_9BACT|nr:hypothetical protein [Larkinella punicea]RCR71463.1 hypothetical protein DUE52_00560 [Larkinella punicea]
MTESEQINQILQDIIDGEYIAITGNSTELYRSAYRKMKAYGLIVPREKTYDITQIGIEVHEAGGFDNWVAANKKRENEIHQATLDTAKATVDAAKSAKESKYAAYVSAVAAIIAFLLPPLLTKDSIDTKTDSTINAMRVRIDTLETSKKRNYSQTETLPPR